MFKGSTFLIIVSSGLTKKQADALHETLTLYNAEDVFVKESGDKSCNFLSPPLITHIITLTVDFIEYNQALKSMIPITTPDWIHACISENKLQSSKPYNPNPAFFMKKCFICCADNLPHGDKDLLYETIKAFGGNYTDVLTKYTTHLIAMDMTNEKSLLAGSLIQDETSRDPVKDIKIVYPHWIDHCIRMGQQLDETKYLVPDTDLIHIDNDDGDEGGDGENLDTLLNDSLPSDTNNDPCESVDFFNRKQFYISSDFNLSQRLSNAVKALIEKYGGIIKSTFDEDTDIYLGRYRSGESYRKSCQKNSRTIVANFQWFYSIVINKCWVSPLDSNILYYPVPIEPIQGFKNLNISITNYSGDARAYLSKLIILMGGSFTRTLTKDNDYLVCAKAEGKKYEAAKGRWLNSWGECDVKVVNHLWLEDCFVKWAKLDDSDERYTNFGSSVGMEPLVGRVLLDKEVLKEQLEIQNLTNETGNIDDSMSEDESTQSRRLLPSSVMSNINKESTTSLSKTKSSTTTSHKSGDDMVSTVSSPQAPPPPMDGTPNKSEAMSDLVSPPKTPNDFADPISGSGRYGGRSAAKKAAAKLHDNMSDLNAYQEMSKSTRKMKHYMDELEKATMSKKKQLDDNTGTVNETTPPESKKQRTEEYEIIAILTGCESNIELSRNNCAKLQSVGIKIINDLSKLKPNTLIAPKILRTEKFLRSLSTVDKIIHPSFIVDVLANVENENVLKQYKIQDYSLDKMNPTANSDLGVTDLQSLLSNKTSSPGSLFADIELNLSSNLNGGVEVISRILKDHGLKNFKEIKASSVISKKTPVLKCRLGNTPTTILIANKTKDVKLINSFKKSIGNSLVLDWDWCVKSIFAMHLQEVDDHKL